MAIIFVVGGCVYLLASLADGLKLPRELKTLYELARRTGNSCGSYLLLKRVLIKWKHGLKLLLTLNLIAI